MNRRMLFLSAILTPIILILIIALVLLIVYQITADIWTPLVATGTIELALIASLQDVIRSWITAPELNIEVSEPDFHRTYEGRNRVYYSRFRVHNKGGASAKKVEVVLNKVYRKEGKIFKPDDSIPSDNLNWSMIGQWVTIPFVLRHRPRTRIAGQPLPRSVRKFIPAIYCDYIAPGTRKFCTLGHIYEPMSRDDDEYGTPRFDLPKEETVFCLEVSFKSNLRYYFLRKGIYGIELQVAASNARAITERFEIMVTGNWFDEEEKMTREGFKIEKVKFDFGMYE